MKKLILSLLVLAPLGLAAQQSTFDKFMNKYNESKGFTCLNLSGSMLSSIGDYVLGSDDSSAYDYDWDLEDLIEEATVVEGYDDWENTEIIVVEIDEDNDDLIEFEVVEMAEECEECGEDATVIDWVIAEEDDEDEDDEDYYDYEDYEDYSSSYSDALKSLKDIKSLKMVMAENPKKRFLKEIKSLVSEGGYTSVMSMIDNEDDIRIYVTGEENETQDMLFIVGDKDQYVVLNIIGNSDLMSTIMQLAGSRFWF